MQNSELLLLWGKFFVGVHPHIPWTNSHLIRTSPSGVENIVTQYIFIGEARNDEILNSYGGGLLNFGVIQLPLHDGELSIENHILKYSKNEYSEGESSHCQRGVRGTPTGAILGSAIFIFGIVFLGAAYKCIDKPYGEGSPYTALGLGAIGFAIIAQATILFLPPLAMAK